MGQPDQRGQINLRDAVMPISLIVSIVGGALVIQSRLLQVEFAVLNLKQWIEQREDANYQRLRNFAQGLTDRNPNLNVPEVK
jgi:hypothetical protein